MNFKKNIWSDQYLPCAITNVRMFRNLNWNLCQKKILNPNVNMADMVYLLQLLFQPWHAKQKDCVLNFSLNHCACANVTIFQFCTKHEYTLKTYLPFIHAGGNSPADWNAFLRHSPYPMCSRAVMSSLFDDDAPISKSQCYKQYQLRNDSRMLHFNLIIWTTIPAGQINKSILLFKPSCHFPTFFLFPIRSIERSTKRNKKILFRHKRFKPCCSRTNQMHTWNA